MAAQRPPVLLGRTAEREALDLLLEHARGGRGEVLVLRGEAGVGKTALLRYCARQASGFRVARVAGVEAETELPFAGLHQLCAPLIGRVDGLPEPQREALAVALGMASGATPDRFLLALAVLSLLSAAAEERPLLCLVDDVEWLDGASLQVLGFVARRLLAEPIAIAFAAREPGRELHGLAELRLGGLEEADARALLARAVPGRLDEPVRDRIVAETRGNPLALLELPRGMSAAELAGGFDPPAGADLPGRLEGHYLRRVGALPGATQQLMLLAAADPVGDATGFWRAAERLGIAASALAPAKRAGLLEVGDRVRFQHPLVRSAVYRAASPGDRRRVHEALAAISDPQVDGDRRAWHRALAAADLDEDVAAELEHSAGRAQTRGGLAAAAAFLERSAGLTADPARRAQRALAAARAKHQAGAPAAALALLASSRAGPLSSLERAQAEVLGAEITFTSNRGSDAPPLLLAAARRLEPLDATLARETYLEALMAAQFAGRLADGAALEIATAARAAPPAPAPRAPDLLLDGLAVQLAEGHAAAAPLLRRAVDAFLGDDLAANGGYRWLWLVEKAAIELWDHDAWYELARRELPLVRAAGALTVLPLALSSSIVARAFAGELAATASLIDEVTVVTEATGSRPAPYGSLIVAAWRGRADELSALTDATLAEAVPRGEGIGMSAAEWADALLHNGLGGYERALASAQKVLEPPGRLDGTVNWVLPELIEAAVRCDRVELAVDAVSQLSAVTRPAGTDWALGVEARSRALLLGDDASAEPLYREAIERLGRTRVRGEHARAHLLYGEWLRRRGRRVDARDRLRAAHTLFTEMGMDGFAERARHELRATGETVRKRHAESRGELTPQEEHIARLARDGLTNAEIGSRLFLSPRTVEWHLKKVFAKLGISSRIGLPDALPDTHAQTAPV